MPSSASVPANQSAPVNTDTLNRLLNQVLRADMDKEVYLPDRSTSRVTYGAPVMDADKTNILRRKYLDLGPTTYSVRDYRLLNILNRWMFRHSDDLVRAASLSLGSILTPYANPYASERPEPARGRLTGDKAPVGLLISESESFLVDLMWRTMVSGSMEAKLPMTQFREAFENLERISSPEVAINIDGQLVAEAIQLYQSTSPNMLAQQPQNPGQDPQADRDYVAKRLVIVTRAISEYRQPDRYCKLRSFLNGMTSYLVFLRILAPNEGRVLAADLQNMLTATDRSLVNNAVTANNLLQRLQFGQPVYKEMLDLAQQHYRLISADLNAVFVLFTRLVTQYKELGNDDVANVLERMMTTGDVKTQYMLQISSSL